MSVATNTPLPPPPPYVSYRLEHATMADARAEHDRHRAAYNAQQQQQQQQAAAAAATTTPSGSPPAAASPASTGYSVQTISEQLSRPAVGWEHVDDEVDRTVLTKVMIAAAKLHSAHGDMPCENSVERYGDVWHVAIFGHTMFISYAEQTLLKLVHQHCTDVGYAPLLAPKFDAQKHGAIVVQVKTNASVQRDAAVERQLFDLGVAPTSDGTNAAGNRKRRQQQHYQDDEDDDDDMSESSKRAHNSTALVPYAPAVAAAAASAAPTWWKWFGLE